MGSSLYFFLFSLFLFHFQSVSSSIFLSSNSSSSSPTLCHHNESLALVHFKNSFSIITGASGYASYPKTETWREGTDCCLWDGVKCDIQTGFVIEINLSGSMLYGSFHSNNTLFNLSHLQKFDLSFNYFNNVWKISPMFGKFSYLTHLNLSYSGFEGRVPSEISQLSNLISLDLSNYDLSLGASTFIKLAQNLTNLKELILSGTNMSLVSPQSFMNLSTSLSTLKLSYCGLQLQANVLEYVHLPRLASLDLSGNYDLFLENTVSSNLFRNLTNLRELDLSEVNMSLVSPDSFFNMSSLSSLRLSRCDIVKGKFLVSDNFPNLISLDLSHNDNLILESFNFFNKLEELDLTYVNMSSVPPNFFSNLSSLSSLKLYNCDLRGRFPQRFPNLISLDLSHNDNLILQSFNFFNKLEELDLTYVNMSSVPPNFFSNLSSLSSLKLYNCDLRGRFPQRFPNLISLDLSYNENLILESFTFSKLQEIHWTDVNMSLVPLDSFMNLSSSLSSLTLTDCGLRGKFPATILQRPNLQHLDLRDNPNITRFLPPMGNWSNSNSLEYLSLSGCNFVGSNNFAFLGNLTQLSVLDLSNKNFGGTEIPYSFGNLVKRTVLDLSFCNLSGQIPSSLGNLKNLIFLTIENNNILGGPIPNSFGNLTQLQYLQLSNNRLTGPIPSQLHRLSSLTNLDLSNNLLSSIIPLSLFTGQFQHNASQLSYIDLSNNKLHGPIPSSVFKIVSLNALILSSNDKLIGNLPSSICQLKHLQILDLSNNSFGGSIPKCTGQFNSLQVLHLGMNYFNGTIPPSFSKGNNLKYLNFNGNQLRGKIPPSIINCRSLEVLDLGDNKIVGTFPFFLGALPQLMVLVLRSNKLHGLFRNFSRKYSFPQLQIFDLSNNNLSGPMPSQYFHRFKAMMLMQSDFYITYMGTENGTRYDYSVKLTIKGSEIEFVEIQTILVAIDFSQNKLTGEIPKSIEKLKALINLNLSHNCLTGNIQSSLGNLINLESLDLSSNFLVGRIPQQLVDLKFLQVFRVSYNQLEGSIPTGKQFNTFDGSSYEGNVGLCGFPLKKECGSGETQQLNQPKEEDSRSENGFGWKAVLEGYGCGVIFGIVVGCVIFRTRKRSWFVRMIEAEGYFWRRKFEEFKKTRRSHRRRN